MEIKALSRLIFTAILIQGTWSLPDPPKECLLDIDPGSGSKWIESFAFNRTDGKCVHLWYGGADGNKNRFKTIDDCEDFCEPIDLKKLFSSHPAEACSFKIDSGKLYNNWTAAYAFNTTSRKCEKFWYGGKLGNANRFETAKECRMFCKLGPFTPEDAIKLWDDLVRNVGMHNFNSDLELRNYITQIIRGNLWDKYVNFSDDILIKVALAVDKIDDIEYKPVQSPSNVKKIATNITTAVQRILATGISINDIIGQTDPPGLLETLYERMTSNAANIKEISILKEFIKSIILEKKGPFSDIVERDIAAHIDEVFSQYHELTWKTFIFEIAHDVNYYVEQALAKPHFD